MNNKYGLQIKIDNKKYVQLDVHYEIQKNEREKLGFFKN